MGGLHTQEPPEGQNLHYNTLTKRKLERCVHTANTRLIKLNNDPVMHKVQKVTENTKIIFHTLQSKL
jgi:hypothetical protein